MYRVILAVTYFVLLSVSFWLWLFDVIIVMLLLQVKGV